MHRKAQANSAVILGIGSLLIAFGLVINIKAIADYYLQSPLIILEMLVGAVLLIFGAVGMFFASR